MTDQLYKALKIYRFSYLLLCGHVILGRKNEFQMTVLVTALLILRLSNSNLFAER